MILAFVAQEGGCDYTIGCGLKIVQLKAETLPQAYEEIVEYADIEGVRRIQIFGGEILADWEVDSGQFTQP